MLIYGAGGHGKVIKEAIGSNEEEIKCFFDDNDRLDRFCGIDVMTYSADHYSDLKMIIAIGDNRARRKVSTLTKHELGIVIDKDAYCSSSMSLGKGTVILKGGIIQSDVLIGQSVIVNTGAIVEHDCKVGDFVHLAPGSILCGGVKVGQNSMIGAGSIVLPGIQIGENCVVGAGAVVNVDLKDGVKVVGNPCRKVN